MALVKLNSRGTDNIGGRRNLIINGAMQVAQRGTVANAANKYGGADRYQFAAAGGADATLSQDTDVPTGQGFSSSQKVDVTTAGNMSGSGHYAMIRQKIEGQNLQHLLYGTASAKKLTLQFWVKSPKTGTHIVELYHGDVNYFNSQTYTIASANTWQKVILTFDGYQTTALDNDNGIGIQVAWWLAASATYNSGSFSSNTWHNDAAKRAVGQVNVFDNASNNFYFTGVQLEVGDIASDFEHRSFDEELNRCYRYCYVWKAEQTFDVFCDLNVWTSSTLLGQYALPMHMNHDPAIDFSAAGDFVFSANNADRVITALALNRSTPRDVQIFATDVDHGFSQGVGGFLRAGNNTTASVTLESEI